jgi:hypothetical protein
MTLPPIAVLKEADERGLKLEAHGDDLHVIPGDRVPVDLVPLLKAHKPQLLTLLRLPFVMVDSQILGETILFCEDEDTKGALVEAGAEPWSIYTKDELRILVANNRAKPFLPDELCKLHEMKWTFHGRITK